MTTAPCPSCRSNASSLGRVALLALGLLLTFVDFAPAQTRRTVVLSGDTETISSATWRFLDLRTSVINADGEVAFTALIERTNQTTLDRGSIWWEDGDGDFKLIAADGNAAANAGTSQVYANLLRSHASLSAAGHVAFRGSIASSTTTPIPANNDSALWMTTTSQSSTELIFREGVAAEDVGSAVYDEQSYDTFLPAEIPLPTYPLPVATLNANGRVAAMSRLQLDVDDVTANDDSGIWYDGKSFSGSLVARENAAARGITSLRYGDFTISPRLNDDNEVAFTVPLRTAAGAASGAGVWVGTTSGPTLQARTDATARIDNAVFDTFQEPTLNNGPGSSPEFAFAAKLKVAGSVTTANDIGIWSRRRTNDSGSSLTQLEIVVREGQHAPGTPAAVGFGNLTETILEPTFDGVNINRYGRIAFRAHLNNLSGSTVTVQNDTGLWVRELGLLSTLETNTRLVAREGDSAPGAEGTVFGTLTALTTEPTFSEPTINSLGQVAFMAHLVGSGVTAANDQGIWVKNGPGPTLLLAREGFPLDVDDGAGVVNRIVASLSMWTNAGGEDGRRSGLNSPTDDTNSQLVFSATFTDNSSGVFVVTLPPVPPPPIAGDYNGNGRVDAPDYTIWRNSLGRTGSGLPADGNGDGTINNDDYLYWKTRFGNTAGSGAGASLNPVPEPAGAVLVGVLACGLACLRRRPV